LKTKNPVVYTSKRRGTRQGSLALGVGIQSIFGLKASGVMSVKAVGAEHHFAVVL